MRLKRVVFGVVGGHHSLVALFDEQAQREVFSDPASLVSTVFRLSGKTVPEGDGFRLTGGEGRFCSGVDFANWVIVGNAVLRDGAPPEPSFLLIPISEVEIVDDWFTAGMRGTGSRSIRIASTFVPAHRVIRLADMLVGKTPGAAYHGLPAYKLPMGLQQPFTLIGAPLGMARGALSEFAASLGKKLAGRPSEEIADQSATFARLGQAAADIESSYGLVIDTCRRIDAAVDPTGFTPLDRALVKRNLAFAAQKSRAAVNSLFEASGGSGIYDGSALQRSWRDINAATGHVAFTWDAAASAYGRALAGLPPSRFAMP